MVAAIKRVADARLMCRTIFTGGSDCLVRIHKAGDPDSEPGFHDNHTDEITSLTCSVGSLASVATCIAEIA
jgi:hypothetical protein